MKLVVSLSVAAALLGCGGKSTPVIATCENPVEFSDQSDVATFGFFVSIHDNFDVNAEAVRLMEQYPDLEVYSAFSTCNCFHANSSTTTLDNLKCEASVKALQHNNAVGPN